MIREVGRGVGLLARMWEGDDHEVEEGAGRR